MSLDILQRSFATHNGTFHADDVAACALLLTFDCIDKKKVVRTREKKEIQTCEYVCDVGGVYNVEEKRFDHHQLEYQGDLSSAGMVLDYLRLSQKIDQKQYTYLDRHLVRGIDQIDNGLATMPYGHCCFSSLIAYFVPPRYDSSDLEKDKAFLDAVDFTVALIQRMLAKEAYLRECALTVNEVMKKSGKLLIFVKALPWMEAFFDNGGEQHPGLFVLMPSAQDNWHLQCIPPSYDERMSTRLALPKKWAGLSDQDLQQASGISGAIFCHKGQFFSVWKTKEDALKAFAMALEGGENDNF